MYLHMYVRMDVQVYVRMYLRTTYVHMNECMYAYIYACVCTYLYVLMMSVNVSVYFLFIYICLYVCIYLYTGCPKRNVRDFGSVFLMLKDTDITQEIFIKSWTFTEINPSEKWVLLAVPNTANCTSQKSRDKVSGLENGMQCSLCLRDFCIISHITFHL